MASAVLWRLVDRVVGLIQDSPKEGHRSDADYYARALVSGGAPYSRLRILVAIRTGAVGRALQGAILAFFCDIGCPLACGLRWSAVDEANQHKPRNTSACTGSHRTESGRNACGYRRVIGNSRTVPRRAPWSIRSCPRRLRYASRRE